MFHQICYDEGGRTRNSSHAVHQDVSLLSRLMDEVGCSAEVDTEVVAGMILARNVKGVGNVLFGVTNVNVFACSKKRAYFVF